MHSVFAVIAVLAVLYLGLRLTMAWLFPYPYGLATGALRFPRDAAATCLR